MFWYWGALKPEYFNFALPLAGLHYGLGVSNLHKMVLSWYVTALSLEIEK